MSLALDLTRLALRLAEGVVPPSALEPALREELTDLDPTLDPAHVLEDARRAERGARIEPEEEAVFAAWFGTDAAALVLQDDDLDVVTFAGRYPHLQAARLLRVLIKAVGQDAVVTPTERARLLRLARALNIDETLLSALIESHGSPDRSLTVPLQGTTLRVGRAATCDIVLPDLQVAPHHATLLLQDGRWFIESIGEAVVLLGPDAVQLSPVDPGEPVAVGPYTLVHDGQVVRATSKRRFADLQIEDATCTLDNGHVLLHPTSFVAFAGEVIAVVGPSGSGKSTLITALSAGSPTSGAVRWCGRPLAELLRDDPGLVGVVPQDDVLLGELTASETLHAAARLRLPPGAPASEVTARVDRALDELDIAHIAHQRVGTSARRGLSGGQRKRVNVGQALVGKGTEMVCLDEPTSGLDPRAAQGIAHLARRLADRDRVVFVVTHDLTPRVLSQVDHLLVLARGGRMVFFGPVSEALGWFACDTPDAIFDRLGREDPEDLATRWANSEARERWVTHRMRLLAHAPRPARGDGPAAWPGARALRNLWTLIDRYVTVKLRDVTGAAVVLAQPLLLGVVMLVVFPTVTVELLLMLTLSCLWFGMSAGVRELLADRPLARLERRVGVTGLTWLLSKVAVLAPVVAVQAALLVSLVAFGLDLTHGADVLLPLAAVCMLTGVSGLTLGLLVSALSGSPAAAVGALVLLLVPQIAFSGVLVPLSQMGPMASVAAAATHQRYAVDAAIQTGVQVHYLTYAQEYAPLKSGSVRVKLGYAESLDDPAHTPRQLRGVLAGMGLLPLLLAGWALRRV